MRYRYMTQGTCSKVIAFDFDGENVSNIEFFGGCAGNLTAISKLLNGWSADEINDKLAGNPCGRRPTSCTDQLAKAVMAAKRGELSPVQAEGDDDEWGF